MGKMLSTKEDLADALETENLKKLFVMSDNEYWCKELEDREFIYARFFFEARPKGFKTLLIEYANKFTVLARAAKKFEGGILGTVY